jgi:nitroreductase
MRSTRRKLFRCAGVAGGALLTGAAAPDQAAGRSEFLSLFAKRQTVRRYKPDPVPDEHLRQILDAARRGPTCMNQQPWKFLVVRDRTKIDAMRKRTLELIDKRLDELAAQKKLKAAEIAGHRAKSVAFTEGYFTAPVYVAVLVDSESSCSGYALNHDGPIAAAYLMLAARSLGYGTAYLTDGIPESVAREVLSIPSRYHRICVTPIGVPDGWPKPASKRKLEEMVAYETLEGHPPLQPVTYQP